MGDAFEFNVVPFLAALDALPGKLEAGVEKALDRVAEVGLQAKAGEVAKTYARPLPPSAHGRPRTGELAAGQHIETAPLERRVVDGGQAAVPITGFPGGYAERLATLPTSADGVDRANPAAANAEKIIAPQIEPIFEQEVLNALGS